MMYLDTQSIQQRNVDAWLTLQATLDERRIRHVTRTDSQGTLWLECPGLSAYPNCIPMIRIGPEAGNAVAQVLGCLLVPESSRAYAEHVLAQANLDCTMGTTKYRAATREILIETPILFADCELRPKAVLYTLRRMCQQLDVVIAEFWDVFLAEN